MASRAKKPSASATINDLPLEILLHLVSYLRLGDLIRLSHVNGHLFRLLGSLPGTWEKHRARLHMEPSPTLLAVAQQHSLSGSCYEKVLCVLEHATSRNLYRGRFRKEKLRSLFVTTRGDNVYNISIGSNKQTLVLTIWRSKTGTKMQFYLKCRAWQHMDERSIQIKNLLVYRSLVCVHVDSTILASFNLSRNCHFAKLLWWEDQSSGWVKITCNDSGQLTRFKRNGHSSTLTIVGFKSGISLNRFNVPRLNICSQIAVDGKWVVFETISFNGGPQLVSINTGNGSVEVMKEISSHYIQNVYANNQKVFAFIQNNTIMVWDVASGVLLSRTKCSDVGEELFIIRNLTPSDKSFRFCILCSSLDRDLMTLKIFSEDKDSNGLTETVFPIRPIVPLSVDSFIVHNNFVRVVECPDGSIEYYIVPLRNSLSNSLHQPVKAVSRPSSPFDSISRLENGIITTTTSLILQTHQQIIILDFGPKLWS